MKKMMLVIFSLMTFTLTADWLDDIVQQVDARSCWSDADANGIIQQYIDKDKNEIWALEAEQKQNEQENGLAATIHQGSLKAQLIKARATLSYHEKVADYFNDLAQNKKDRDHFVDNCLKLAQLNKELAHLEQHLKTRKNYGKAARTQAKIVAKKAHIEAKRAHMKAPIL